MSNFLALSFQAKSHCYCVIGSPNYIIYVLSCIKNENKTDSRVKAVINFQSATINISLLVWPTVSYHISHSVFNCYMYVESISPLSFSLPVLSCFFLHTRGTRWMGGGQWWEPQPNLLDIWRALALLPTSSWMVLVPLHTQELSYHPPGTNEKQGDEGGVMGLNSGSCSSPRFPPLKISVPSISPQSK